MTKDYQLDFPALMRVCETNYVLLNRLLPRSISGKALEYSIGLQVYRIEILETTRYTTLVNLTQVSPQGVCYGLPSMEVRLYHDARIAEVCASQQISRFKARYDYPNEKLHQRDEKHQINQFLADWLRFCLTRGVMASPIYQTSSE